MVGSYDKMSFQDKVAKECGFYVGCFLSHSFLPMGETNCHIVKKLYEEIYAVKDLSQPTIM